MDGLPETQVSGNRVLAVDELHDETHRVRWTRDYAGDFQICLDCLRRRLVDDPAEGRDLQDGVENSRADGLGADRSPLPVVDLVSARGDLTGDALEVAAVDPVPADVAVGIIGVVHEEAEPLAHGTAFADVPAGANQIDVNAHEMDDEE